MKYMKYLMLFFVLFTPFLQGADLTLGIKLFQSDANTTDSREKIFRARDRRIFFLLRRYFRTYSYEGKKIFEGKKILRLLAVARENLPTFKGGTRSDVTESDVTEFVLKFLSFVFKDPYEHNLFVSYFALKVAKYFSEIDVDFARWLVLIERLFETEYIEFRSQSLRRSLDSGSTPRSSTSTDSEQRCSKPISSFTSTPSRSSTSTDSEQRCSKPISSFTSTPSRSSTSVPLTSYLFASDGDDNSEEDMPGCVGGVFSGSSSSSARSGLSIPISSFTSNLSRSSDSYSGYDSKDLPSLSDLKSESYVFSVQEDDNKDNSEERYNSERRNSDDYEGGNDGNSDDNNDNEENNGGFLNNTLNKISKVFSSWWHKK